MAAFPVRERFTTRWNDNDQYGHINNTVYYQAMDTAVNAWMIREGGLDPGGSTIALCAASSCEFHASASYPDELTVGIGVERVGVTSLTWELGIFLGEDQIATGRFVHVFVDAATRRPTAIPASIREAIDTRISHGKGGADA